ncbi:NitT/TauT family transport system ATP-binding protein/sulfonate transport system ATP-binding protein [Hydrogenispora ethanolica]|jgi:NitT/TauT family transport system ATP-binding protein/sulfonate transport system ATP-binding protein|uniref:NitT/TauT family transport system ATP-binding protein/sulfonate transport system ATP-binding protein n=1 Tax=Hydrogenispora ethanolica TaxID=1082276 RepID=A0A4R1RCM8_HYDET|nr:ABC transporter ATP-binding protein [Hydrogenispora ethanolica]TCL63350.1 NitT/TauT family transport system ATP-binding protein/sulfonate transport system ATP-binding protein [Hydrogenispora ethanolica]
MLLEHQRDLTPGDSNSKQVIIRCDNISKEFNTNGKSFQVIQNIDLEVVENEFVVLFGPGQCGKTTLLNVIAGLEQPTTGTVEVNGKRVEEPGADRGVVYQTTALFPWLTVLGNVEFGPSVRGINKKERRERAKYFINLVGLKGFENHYPVKLSGGMKQRVGIARAYCNDPVVMLMDEPFGHLDAQTRYMMEDELEKIWQRERRTVVFVTNNIEEALFLADRIVLLNNCPTSIKTEYRINLPRPRSYVDPEFLRLRQAITEAMDKSL